jgi:hypothetical protein
MKHRYLLIPVFLVLAASAVGQRGPMFADRAQNMVLRDLQPFAIDFDGEAREIRFAGEGRPFTAVWREEGLTLTGRTLEGLATRVGAAKSYGLRTASLGGGVRIVQDKGGQTVDAEGGSAEVNVASETLVNVRTGVKIQTSGPRAGEATQIDASTAVLTLAGLGGLRRAVLEGPVRIDMSTSPTERLEAAANRAEIDYSSRPAKIVLTGAVTLDGNHPTLAGRVSGVTRAVITLDAERRPTRVDLDGGAGAGIAFSDRAKNMVLRNLHPFSVTLSGNEARFRGEGRPFTGLWAEEGLTLTGRTLSGVAASTDRRVFRLRTATVGGGAGVVQRKGAHTVDARAQTAEITAGTHHRVNLRGNVNVQSKGPASGESLSATGANGTITLEGGGGLRLATLEGGVGIEMRTAADRWLEATSRRAEIDYASNPARVILTGDVAMSGKHPSLATSVSGYERAVVTLDANRQPTRIEFEGGSGKTRIGTTGGGS